MSCGIVVIVVVIIVLTIYIVITIIIIIGIINDEDYFVRNKRVFLDELNSFSQPLYASVIIYFQKMAFSFAPKVTQITSDSLFYINLLTTVLYTDRDDLD